MRALVITTSWPLSSSSLSGRFLAELLEGLVGLGWRFDVVTPAAASGAMHLDGSSIRVTAVSYPGERHGLVHAGGIPDRLSKEPWLACLVPGMCTALAQAAARRAAACDLIWSHWLLPAGWIGARIARRRTLPHLATVHGGDVHLVERLVRAPGARAILAARFSDTRLSAPAERTARRIAAALRVDRVEAAPLPAGVLAPGVRRARTENDPLRLLFLGRFERIKGADLLLEAARRPQTPPLEIVLAGAGRETAMLEEAARTSPWPVRFTGPLTGATRSAALVDADLVVLPSRPGREEGLPHGASLALAAGTPVVTAAGGALEALLERHGAGVAFDPQGGDLAAADALATTLARLWREPGRLDALRRGAREAGESFHPQRALAAWDRVLRSAVRAPEERGPHALALEAP